MHKDAAARPGADVEARVKDANRAFYDAVADKYELVDGRRTLQLSEWLSANLGRIKKEHGGEKLLDIGTGGGFVTRAAAGHYRSRLGLDISPRILAANREAFSLGLAADTDRLPIADESVDIITCFATLHHMYRFEELVNEAARALRPGGVFYSDHDMDAVFFNRFRPALKVYRWLDNANAKYRKASGEVTGEMYELTEWHNEGIDADKVCRLFRSAGFTVETTFHWYGLARFTDRIFGANNSSRGWAPIVSILARKELGE